MAAALPRLKPTFRTIRTLDPSKLVQEDHLDFSLVHRPILNLILHPRQSTDDPPIPTSARSPDFRGSSQWSLDAFPPGTRGFLYYHAPRISTPLAGEIRFRLTSSKDPASFATGTDLLTNRGIPWRYALYKIVSRPSYRGFVALLLQDGLVSQRTLDLVAAAVSAPSESSDAHGDEGVGVALSDARHPTSLTATPVLSAFGQEFTLRYSKDFNFLGIFASPDTILSHRMRTITTIGVALAGGKRIQYSPFTGSVVCRFERSTLPEHAGRRVVVIRVVRMVEGDPIRDVPAPGGHTYPGIEALRPREGELLATMNYRKVRPWAEDVDREKPPRPRMKALKVLFENEKVYGSLPAT